MEIVQITIHAPDEKLKELLSTCQLIDGQTSQREGCKISRVSQNIDNKNIITLEQQWEQWSSLIDYLRSEHFSALLGAMKWLGRSYEIRINRGTREDGMDIVRRARGK